MHQEKYYNQLATILPKMKRFQKAVLEFRREIGIPDRGLPREQRAAWYQAHYRSALEAGRIPFTREPNEELLPRDPVFRKALKRFADRFNLNEIWYGSLFSYLVCDDQETLRVPDYEPYVRVRIDDVRNDEPHVISISMEIDAETKLSDIRAIWYRIQSYQKSMVDPARKRRKPLDDENIQRYIQLRDLEDQGVKQKDIATQLGFESANDVAAFKRDVESRFKK